MTVAILFEIAGLWWRFPVETKINTNLKCGSFNDFSVKLVHLSFEIHNDIKKNFKVKSKKQKIYLHEANEANLLLLLYFNFEKFPWTIYFGLGFNVAIKKSFDAWLEEKEN